jgi:hypothetical protein
MGTGMAVTIAAMLTVPSPRIGPISVVPVRSEPKSPAHEKTHTAFALEESPVTEPAPLIEEIPGNLEAVPVIHDAAVIALDLPDQSSRNFPLQMQVDRPGDHRLISQLDYTWQPGPGYGTPRYLPSAGSGNAPRRYSPDQPDVTGGVGGRPRPPEGPDPAAGKGTPD